MRAECHLLQHEYDSTVGDLSRASALSPALAPHLLLRVALLSSLFLDHGLAIPADSLLPVKRCLSSDPDNKACRGLFKALKSTEKDLARLRNWVEGGAWSAAANVLAGSPASPGLIKSLRAVVESYHAGDPPVLPAGTSPADSPLLGALLSTLCRAYQQIGKTAKAAAVCDEVLARNPDDLWALVAKGDRLIADEEWEEAVRVLNTAFENTGRSDRTVRHALLSMAEGATRADESARRLWRSCRRRNDCSSSRRQRYVRILVPESPPADNFVPRAQDYYKVLGVSRDADAKTVKKA